MGRWTCKRSVQHSGLPGRQYAVASYKLTPRYPETSAFRMARDGRGQPAQLHFILLDETACDHVPARWTRAVQSFPGLKALSDRGPAARGLSCDGELVRSQPPGGSGTTVAIVGCVWTTKALTASWAAARAWASM